MSRGRPSSRLVVAIVAALSLTVSLPVGLGATGTASPTDPAAEESGCTDVERTFTGNITGVPDETLLGTSAEATTHTLELGGPDCRITSLDAQLTSSQRRNTASDGELAVAWEDIELDTSRSPGTMESVSLDDLPYGSYAFIVEPWSAAQTPYTLEIQAHLEPAPGPQGDNADDETVVIAVPDSGINPYHDEFSADTYPGQLNLSQDPANYLEGYPEDAQRLELTLDEPYDQAKSADGWSNAEVRQLYWIPGTKIVGAYDDDSSTGAADSTPILDDTGHGTRSASVAVGNTVGSCERCLLVAVEGFQGYQWAIRQPWIDLVSNSWNRYANVGTPNGPTDASAGNLAGLEDGRVASDLRGAVKRGQTVLFAAGNGLLGGFLTPQTTYTSPYTGPDWVVTVGATQAFNGTSHCDCSRDEGSVLTSGKPVDVSSYAAGHIPAADHGSTTAIGQHSGTSAATPIVAGVMGEVLLAAREALGDTTATTHDPILAEGPPGGNEGLVGDGQLTRAELERAVKLTAEHSRSQWVGGDPPSVPTQALPGQSVPAQWAAEGWGVVAERTGVNATNVVLGEKPIPQRPLDEGFAEIDKTNREALWGPAVEPDTPGGSDDSTDDAATGQMRTILPYSLPVIGSGDHVVGAGASTVSDSDGGLQR